MKLLWVTAQRSVVLFHKVPPNFVLGGFETIVPIQIVTRCFSIMTTSRSVLLRLVLILLREASVCCHFDDEVVVQVDQNLPQRKRR